MLNQSFSAENFRRIIDYENRRGVYLEGRFFPEIEKITEEIQKCNTAIREMKKTSPTQEEFDKFRKEINEKKDVLKKQKEEKLMAALQHVGDTIIDSKFRIMLKKNMAMCPKPTYVIEDKPENYFALKQVQTNFKKLYKVKQANRFAIVSQVKVLLDDRFPKFVLRTDVKDFYENIPHEVLLRKINKDSLLTFHSKKIIVQILSEYRRLSGNTKGLPRGVGVSAYLAELYMRDIDNQIRSLTDVSYYARYVDDIIIIFTPSATKEAADYLQCVKQIVETEHNLPLNAAKTKPFDLVSSPAGCSMDYLGYHFEFGNRPVVVRLTKHKKDKYKKRVDLAFKSYMNLSKVDEKKARKLLLKRIRFLTGNTRLLNNKKRILVGVYFSNSILTESSDFIGLDRYLAHVIRKTISSASLLARLAKLKFIDGFDSKRFSAFSSNELSEILKVWDRE